jgi:hypothetical protein
MKELFIVEADTKGVSKHRLIALIAAVVFLLVFTGCAPAKKASTDESKPWARISFNIDKSSKYAPTFAVWVRDEETGEVATLAATQKAVKGYSGGQARPGALPVWSTARLISGTQDLDAVSSATPSGASATLYIQIPDKFKGKKISICIEVNVSYDYNSFYKQGLKAGDTGYNDVNGQPSVLWKATLDTAANPSGTVKPEIAGHGDVLGAPGDVDADMAQITTAASIFNNIEIEYGMGK